MLANTRFCFLLIVLLVFALGVSLPSAAQGIPASVTSLGFGGSNNPTPGVAASVTSLGPNGYAGVPFVGNFGNCCANTFWPYGVSTFGPNPPLAPLHHHRHHWNADHPFGPIVEPVYIPYAVPYAAEQDDEAADYQDAADRESVRSRPGQRQLAAKGTVGSKAGRDSDRVPADESVDDPLFASEKLADSVAAQPATMLIFKDGHRSDVVNYAIIGDTLFHFAGGRARKIQLADLDLDATRKANDDQGIDFKVPPASGKRSGTSN